MSNSTLTENTAALEKIYDSPPTMNDTSPSSKPHYKGEDIKLPTLPPDVKNMVNKGFFALAFFVAILSGTGIGMGIVSKYKFFLLVIVIFLLVLILAPDISDYFIYGVGEYIDFGYKGLKKITNNVFLKLKNQNPNPTTLTNNAQPSG